MSVTTISTPQAPAAIGPYSQAVVAGGFLFSAGQIALEPASGSLVPGGIVAETEQVLANLTAVLASAGATWGDVVRTTIFLADLGDFAVVNESYGARLGEARPARSTVQVAALPRSARIEIDVVAWVGG